jgi:hypothetical protein
MKPIDVIKQRLDYDFIKYRQIVACDILNIKSIRGVGLVAKVSPKGDENVDALASQEGGEDRAEFMVVCVNRPFGWMEWNIKEKYDAYVLSIINDNIDGCPALIVPKTYIDNIDDWDEKKEVKLENKVKENIIDHKGE